VQCFYGSRMKKWFAVLTFAVCWTTRGSAAPEPQHVEAKAVSAVSATVELLPDKPLVIVRITNNGEIALDAWEIRLLYTTPSTPRGEMGIASDATSATDYATAQVPSKGTRVKTYALDGIATNASVSVTMALFADLSREGDTGQAAFLLAEREKRAVTLTAWLDALQKVAGKTPDEARMAMRAELKNNVKLASRSDDSFAQALRENMSMLIDSGIGESALAERLAALMRNFAAQRDRELRHTKR